MGLLARLLGTFRKEDAHRDGGNRAPPPMETDRARQEKLGHRLHGGVVIQTPEEQQVIRDHMVAELDSQRESRGLSAKG